MTTFDPGASDVLTHGLLARPRSTAFLASRPAPTITNGFDVFVHDVIAATTTAPWSSSYSAPSSSVTRTASLGRPPSAGAALGTRGRSASVEWCVAGGSLAGNDSRDDSSTLPLLLPVPSTY